MTQSQQPHPNLIVAMRSDRDPGHGTADSRPAIATNQPIAERIVARRYTPAMSAGHEAMIVRATASHSVRIQRMTRHYCKESRMRMLIAGLAFLTVAAFSVEADAHAKLLGTTPANGTAVAALTEIKLKFDEPVIYKLSGIDLSTKAGEKVAVGKMAADPADKATAVVAITAPLKAGAYKVHWHVVSDDSHKVEGNFTFEVKE
jgi:methionine-rich copper-binding protein CopC